MDNTENDNCRLCAKLKPHDKLFNLQTDQKKCQDIVNMLTRFNVLIDFKGNILPNVACNTCINSLQSAFNFITAVEQAQSTLSDLISVEEIKKEEKISDDENFEYEPPACFDNNIKNVKQESDKRVSHSKSVLLESTQNSSDDNSSKNEYDNFDALPLAQLKLTWQDYNWLCYYCGTQFPTIDELKSHSMQYHSACNSYRCTDCNRGKFRLDSFIVHVKRHRQYLKLSCYKCIAKFSNLRAAFKHRATHNSTNYICKGCNTYFSNLKELEEHVNAFYRKSRGRDGGPRSRMCIQVQDNTLTCPICNKSCNTKRSLNTHLLTHTDRTKDHTCEVCGKCFYLKGALTEHMVKHTDARPFQCEICKARFKTSRRLRLHIGVHDGQKPFACNECGKSFRLKKQLANHCIIHTDSLPHICSYCNKGFRFRTILNQHVRQHTGVKPYSCKVCTRDFTNWPNYNKHMKRRHGMDMAKKKCTPDGTYPIDPATGEVVYPLEPEKIREWKKAMMEQGRASRLRIKTKRLTQSENNNNS